MSKFKVGDRVRCVVPGVFLKLKECPFGTVTYVGTKAEGNKDFGYWLKVTLENGKMLDNVLSFRFALVEEEKMFNISTATDKELADEYRRMRDEIVLVARALQDRNYTMRRDGVLLSRGRLTSEGCEISIFKSETKRIVL
jgi:hypothetical protein